MLVDVGNFNGGSGCWWMWGISMEVVDVGGCGVSVEVVDVGGCGEFQWR